MFHKRLLPGATDRFPGNCDSCLQPCLKSSIPLSSRVSGVFQDNLLINCHLKQGNITDNCLQSISPSTYLQMVNYQLYQAHLEAIGNSGTHKFTHLVSAGWFALNISQMKRPHKTRTVMFPFFPFFCFIKCNILLFFRCRGGACSQTCREIIVFLFVYFLLFVIHYP